jgi:mannose-6-phosphate isomerase-like protein (cupin superfamily)
MSELATEAPGPPDLHFTMTGEKFEFQTSAKHGDGVFRFRWTLGATKKGPPEHLHEGERETFHVVSGVLRIWLEGVARDLGPDESVTVDAGVRHRFLNPSKTEPVVVDVSLDGPLQEDALVPLAYRLQGSTRMRLSDFCVMVVHTCDVRASRPPSRVADAIVRGLGRVFRLFGARPLLRAAAWSDSRTVS